MKHYQQQLSTRYTSPAPVSYVTEVRSTSSAYAPGYSRGSRPVVVFVRGYQAERRVYAKTVGICDGRSCGPRSRQHRLLTSARKRIERLARKEAERQSEIAEEGPTESLPGLNGAATRRIGTT